MKKKELFNKVLFPEFSNKKLVLMLNWTIILTFLFVLKVSANSYSQNVKVDLDFQNVKFKRAFSILEQKGNIRLLYSEEYLPAGKYVTLSVRDTPVMDVLGLVLKDTDLKFRVLENGLIVISPRNNEIKEIVVRGQVTDSKGETLPGVSIKLKGTAIGATTDLEGRYTITVPDNNSILVFTYIGYVMQEVAVNNQTSINVKLEAVDTALDEVVVVGYGTQRRRDMTGSVSSIGTAELKAQPISSFNQALQGRVSGLQLTQSSNAPGGGVTIRIRGGNSISASNDPLYVIDGFPISNPAPASGAGNSIFYPNPLASINPNDIESIEVLKDASATAIYGSRGANGVVLVATRRGKEGQSNIDFETYYGVQQITKMLDLVTAEQHLLAKNEQLRNLGFPERYGNPNGPYPKTPAEYGEGTNWQKEIYRIAPIQNYQLSFSGGNEKLRYLVSANYFDQDGIVIANNYKRYNSRINLDAKVSNEVKIGSNFTISRSLNSSAVVVESALGISPASPVYDANGNYQLLNVGPGSGFGGYSNPVAVARTSTNLFTSDRVLGNIFGEIQLIEGLSARISVGADILSTRRNVFYTPQTLIASNLNGYGSNGNSNNLNLLNENTLTYTRSIDNHAFDVVGGITFQSNREERTYIEAQDFPNYTLGANNLGLADKPLPPRGALEEWGLNSYLGRINYRFRDRYLFTLTGRVDGSSRFGANNKYGFFPSGAFAWRVSDEAFLNNSKTISDLKVRVSYGITGNDGIGLYNSLSQYSTGRTVFGDKEVLMTQASRIANPDLRWEKTAQSDVGIDLGLLNNRFQITADYYIKTTSDLLLGVQLPATTGFTGVIRNVGSLENRGFELGINTINIDGTFKWSSNGNISFNRNKVLKLNDADQFFTGNGIVKVGEPVGSFYGSVFDGIWQTKDEIKAAGAIARAGDLPGAIRYKDLNGDGIFNAGTDRQILGNGLPKFIFGLTNTFSYKKVDLSVFFQGVQGNHILNNNRRSMETSDPSQALLKSYFEGAWRADKPSLTLPSIRQWRPTNTDSFYIEDGSFIRLKNVSLGYQVPLNTKFIRKARIYLSGQNLLIITKYRGYDPEVNSAFNSNTDYGIDAYAYPPARTYTFGATLSF